MKSKEAVVKRINELCAVNDIALNELANRSGITPSTVYNITLREFFNSDCFDDIEQEIY